MIELYSRKIAAYFSQIGVITPDKIDIYRFFFETFFYKLITYSISLLIFIALDKLLAGIVFLVVFMGMRSITGGYHTNKAINCLILSPAIIGINGVVIKYFPISILWIIGLGYALAIAAIIKWAPLSNENNVLTDYEIKQSKKKYSICISLTTMLMFIFWKASTDIYVALGMAYISDAMLLFLGVLVQKRRCEKCRD